MANEYNIWNSATGAFDAAGSWSVGTPSGKMNVLDGTSQQDVTSGLGSSGAPTTCNLFTTEDYTGDLGGPGNPLWIVTAGKAITHRGEGTMYLGSSVAITEKIVIDSENQLLAADIYGGAAQLHVKRGYVVVGASTSFVTGYVGVVGTSGPDAHLLIEGSGTGTNEPGLMYCHGGTFTNNRTLVGAAYGDNIIVVTGGTFTQDEGLLSGYTVVYHFGGTFIYRPTAAHVNGEFIYVGIDGTGNFTQTNLVSTAAFAQTIIGPNSNFLPALGQDIDKYFDIDLRELYP